MRHAQGGGGVDVACPRRGSCACRAARCSRGQLARHAAMRRGDVWWPRPWPWEVVAAMAVGRPLRTRAGESNLKMFSESVLAGEGQNSGGVVAESFIPDFNLKC